MINTDLDKSKQNYYFTAIVEKRNSHDVHRFGCVRILLREVRFNGNLLFRDHVWIKEDKRTSKLQIGDLIHFSSRIQPYLDIDNLSTHKLGLSYIRNIKRLHHIKRFKKNIEAYRSRTSLKKYLEKYNENIKPKEKKKKK